MFDYNKIIIKNFIEAINEETTQAASTRTGQTARTGT